MLTIGRRRRKEKIGKSIEQHVTLSACLLRQSSPWKHQNKSRFGEEREKAESVSVNRKSKRVHQELGRKKILGDFYFSDGNRRTQNKQTANSTFFIFFYLHLFIYFFFLRNGIQSRLSYYARVVCFFPSYSFVSIWDSEEMMSWNDVKYSYIHQPIYNNKLSIMRKKKKESITSFFF